MNLFFNKIKELKEFIHLLELRDKAVEKLEKEVRARENLEKEVRAREDKIDALFEPIQKEHPEENFPTPFWKHFKPLIQEDEEEEDKSNSFVPQNSITLPTVEINRNGSKVIINRCDFDPMRDTLWRNPKK